MILGLLRERLQGARRIPLSIGKCLVGFEPFRRILGAPHGYRSLGLSGGNDVDTDGEINLIGPVETREEISVSPAQFAMGKEVESKLFPCRFVANARPMYLLRNGKYRNTTGHFEFAVLDSAGQISELSPDAIGPDLHRIYGQFSLRKKQHMGVRKIAMHVHADFSLREVQGLLSEIGGVREIHAADLVDVYSRQTRRGEPLIFLRTACSQVRWERHNAH
jgi:hypothetical protein